MSTASLAFFVFVLAAFVLHRALPVRARRHGLLLSSYVFFALLSWRLVPVLVLVTLVTVGIAPRLGKGRAARRAWLWSGVMVLAALLLSSRAWFSRDPFAGVFVVTGVSFYALQAISYLADVYSGALAAPLRPLDVALYLAYFPKLVAGPIERAHRFVPQIERPQPLDDDAVGRAAALIALGLTRKIVIADPLAAQLPAHVFSSPNDFGGFALLCALIGYAIVLYNDFAGYTDVVRGVSLLFGIELSQNFAQPFFARSFGEFWSRWHITLSFWLRDYVYMPCARFLLRRTPRALALPNTVGPPMITMLVSGLWHGTSVHMVLWGSIHGGYLVGERLRTIRRRRDQPRSASGRRAFAAGASVFCLGIAALAWFRMDTHTAFQFWRQVLAAPGAGGPGAAMLFSVAGSLLIDAAQYRAGDELFFLRWRRPYRALLLALAVLLWVAIGQRIEVQPFRYAAF